MVCRGLYFDELERIVNIKNSQLKETTKTKTGKPKRGKSKAVYIERKV
jgi:hypothetical protein